MLDHRIMMERQESLTPKQSARERVKRKIRGLLHEIDQAAADIEALRVLWGQQAQWPPKDR
jgi:hypothetical protein